MQDSLFSPADAPASGSVRPASHDAALLSLARQLPDNLRLGTSSWHYPGWATLVWDRLYSETQLSRDGLSAYAAHPLFRTVGVDRGFYKPLTVADYAHYAAQVPADFRFVLKAPSLVTDAQLRGSDGSAREANPAFLSEDAAASTFVEPALAGLGSKLGALVFQISPLPGNWLKQMPRLIAQLHRLLASLPAMQRHAPDAVVAVEVRDPQWLTDDFIAALRDTGATYCLGLHAKMPPISEQLPVLRALWPGPLVCRWNLNPVHGAYGYEDAHAQYHPYNKLRDPDPETRTALARVIAGTVGAGQPAYVTLSNKAEGCSPLSAIALAQAILDNR